MSLDGYAAVPTAPHEHEEDFPSNGYQDRELYFGLHPRTPTETGDQSNHHMPSQSGLEQFPGEASTDGVYNMYGNWLQSTPYPLHSGPHTQLSVDTNAGMPQVVGAMPQLSSNSSGGPSPSSRSSDDQRGRRPKTFTFDDESLMRAESHGLESAGGMYANSPSDAWTRDHSLNSPNAYPSNAHGSYGLFPSSSINGSPFQSLGSIWPSSTRSAFASDITPRFM